MKTNFSKKIYSIIFYLLLIKITGFAQSVNLQSGGEGSLRIKGDFAIKSVKRDFQSRRFISYDNTDKAVLIFYEGGELHGLNNPSPGKILLIFNGSRPNNNNELIIKHMSVLEPNDKYKIKTPSQTDYSLGYDSGGVMLFYDLGEGAWIVLDKLENGINNGRSFWSLTGNLGTNSNFNFIGSRDSTNLNISPNDLDGLNFDAKGNFSVFASAFDSRGGFYIPGNIAISKLTTISANTPITTLNTLGASRVSFNTSGTVDVTGINYVGEGTLLVMFTNASTSVVFKNNASLAANVNQQIQMHTNADFTLPPNSGIFMIYGENKWRVISIAIPPAQAPANSWLISGNSNTTASNFIGSINNQALNFKVNNQQKIQIGANGNVGIGSNADNSARLKVSSGSSGLGVFSTMSTILESNVDFNVKTTSLWNQETGIKFAKPEFNNNSGRIKSTSNNIFFGVTNNNIGLSVAEYANTSKVNIGINTQSPAVDLDVNGQMRMLGKRILLTGNQQISYNDLARDGNSFISFGGSGTATINGIVPGASASDLIGTILYITSSETTTVRLMNNVSSVFFTNKIRAKNDITIGGLGGAVLVYEADGWRVISFEP